MAHLHTHIHTHAHAHNTTQHNTIQHTHTHNTPQHSTTQHNTNKLNRTHTHTNKHKHTHTHTQTHTHTNRGNALGAEGWGAKLETAVGLVGLTAVEPLGAEWRGLIEGRLQSLELRGKLRGEAGLAGVVAAGYLGRSASCLTRLDMRCPPLAPSLSSK